MKPLPLWNWGIRPAPREKILVMISACINNSHDIDKKHNYKSGMRDFIQLNCRVDILAMESYCFNIVTFCFKCPTRKYMVNYKIKVKKIS